MLNNLLNIQWKSEDCLEHASYSATRAYNSSWRYQHLRLNKNNDECDFTSLKVTTMWIVWKSRRPASLPIPAGHCLLCRFNCGVAGGKDSSSAAAGSLSRRLSFWLFNCWLNRICMSSKRMLGNSVAKTCQLRDFGGLLLSFSKACFFSLDASFCSATLRMSRMLLLSIFSTNSFSQVSD